MSETTRYQALFDQHPDAVYELDLTGRIVAANSHLETLLGYTADELRELTFRPNTHPEDLELVETGFADSCSGTASSYRCRAYRRNGELFDIRVINLPIFDGDGWVTGVFGIASDITAELQADLRAAAADVQMREMFDQVPLGLFTLNEHGTFLTTNAAWRTMCGYSQSELQTTNFWDMVAADDTATVLPQARQLLDGDTNTVATTTTLVRADGQLLTIRSQVSVLPTPGTPRGAPVRLLAVVENITAQDTARRHAERSHSLLTIAGRVGRFGGWALDVETDELYWSDEIYRLLELEGTPPPDTATALSFYPDGDRRVLQHAMRRCAQDGKPFDVQCDIVTATGRWLRIRTVGEPVRDTTGNVRTIHGASIDITEAHVADLAQIELTAQLQTTLESVNDGVLRVGADGTVTYANRRACELLGRELATIVGDVAYELFPRPASDTRLESAWRTSRDQRQRVTVTDLHCLTCGRWLDLLLLPDGDGTAVHFQDVTLRVEREQQLQRVVEAEQQSAERLREIDEVKSSFLTAVSHEIRTPLTSVSGMADTLARHDSKLEPAVRRRLLDGIRDNARRLDVLMADLLDLEQSSANQLQTARLSADVVVAVTDAIRASAIGDLVALHAPDTLHAQVDVHLLDRVVAHLLDNCAKYAPGAACAVTLERVASGGFILTVADDGPGIPALQRSRVFEPFHRHAALGARPGTGIGLALVKAFAELHGGSVRIVSEVPGTSIEVTFGP